MLIRKILLLCFSIGLAAPGYATTSSAGSATHFDSAVRNLETFQCDKAIIESTRCLLLSNALPDGARRKAYRARIFALIGQAMRFDENDIASAQAYAIASALTPDKGSSADLLCKRDLEANRGDALERSSEFERAQPVFDKISATKTPTDVERLMLAHHFSRLGEEERAEATLSAGGKATEHDSRFLLLKARTLVRRGLTDEAIHAFEQASKTEASAYLSDILMALAQTMNHATSAREYIQKAGKIMPNDPLWRDYYAESLSRDGKPRATIKEYTAAVQAPRLCTRAYKNLATYLGQQKKHPEALRCMNHIAKLRPYAPDVYITRAAILEGSGDLKAAISDLRQAIAIDKYAILAYPALSKLLRLTHQDQEATAVLRQAVAVVPTNIPAWRDLGYSEFEINDTTNARKDLLKALDVSRGMIDRSNIVVKNEIATVHAALGTMDYINNNMEGALEQARLFNKYKFAPILPPLLRALHIRPGRLESAKTKKEQAFLDKVMLGDMLLETKHYSQSITEFKAGTELNPDDVDIHSYLLEAYAEDGDWLKAAQQDVVVSQKVVARVPNQIKRAIGQ